MHRIILRNSCIIIQNYKLGDCPNLERNFQVWDQITHKFETLGMYYDEENNNLYIPRGLDIWKIEKYLNLDSHQVDAPADYDHIDDILMKYKPRDVEQIEALKFMCGIGQDYEENFYQPQLSVNLNTGKGKTYCSIATISYMKIKSIIITGSNTLLEQWKSNILEYTNLKEEDILFIIGSDKMNMIMMNKSKQARNAKIFLCTHGTIRSFAKEYGWDKLHFVFEALGIGMKFIDEAHTNFNNMLMLDFFTNVFKTFYVTATPERSDWREDRIYQLSIKNVPGIDLFDQDKDPHTDYVAIKWNSHPTAMQLSSCFSRSYGLNRMKYIDYLTQQPNFYKIMTIVMDMVIKCKGRVLIYIGTNESILRVYKWIGTNYPEFLGDIGIYTSLVDKKDKTEREKGKKLLLSTTKSAGLGEHIEGLKMTIVVAEPFKSEVLAIQTLGRTRDKNTTYIELVDLGFPILRRFYYSKLPVFNKYALSVSDTTIDQYELDRRCEILNEQRYGKINNSPIYLRDERFFDYTERDLKDAENMPKKIIKPIYFE